MSLNEEAILFGGVLEKLRASARADRSVEAAQIHLINLKDVMASVGPQWPKVKERIWSGSIAFLRGCLDDDDIVLPCGDGFLIIYAHGEPAVLAARSRQLQSLLTEFYCGQGAAGPDLKVSVDHHSAEGEEAIRALISGRAAEPAALGPAEADQGHEIKVMPVWSPRASAIISYCFYPAYGPDCPGYDPVFRFEGRNQIRDCLELDLRMLDLAIAAVGAGAMRPQPAIGTVVHASTLATRPSRAAYFDRLKSLPAAAQRYFFVKIGEIGRGAPLVTVADWVGQLRPRVRQVLIEFHHSDDAIASVGQTGAWGAGFFLPDRMNSAAEAEKAERRLRFWTQTLRDQKTRFFVDNLRSPAMLRAAVEAEAMFVTSPDYWPAVRSPGGVIAAPAPYVAAPLPNAAANEALLQRI